MKKYFRFILQHPLRHALSLALFGCLAMPVSATELVSIKNVTLVESDSNDGDSFKVNADGRELHLRLYYVDCLETAAYGFVKERIRQQKDHFALKSIGTVLDFGKQAAAFTRRVLSRPFTIHTSYAKAPGGSGRHYAFVETSDSQDLGRLLVEQGLARIHGKTHDPTPYNTSGKTMSAQLDVARDVAMLKQAGIWRTTDIGLFLKTRLADIDDRGPVNLNTATSEQLQQIKGIGPATADKIIAARPYRSVDELLKIPGIGPKKLKAIAPYVKIETK